MQILTKFKMATILNYRGKIPLASTMEQRSSHQSLFITMSLPQPNHLLLNNHTNQLRIHICRSIHIYNLASACVFAYLPCITSKSKNLNINHTFSHTHSQIQTYLQFGRSLLLATVLLSIVQFPKIYATQKSNN